MKNIAQSLLMILLFGIICPNHQAFASGKNMAMTIQREQINTKVSEDLIDKLANSKIFEAIYDKFFITQAYLTLNMSLKTVEERNIFMENLNKLNKGNITPNEENIRIYQNFGFPNLHDLEIFNSNLTDLKNKLVKSFPEINLMSKDEIEKVFEAAIEKGNLREKAITLLTKDECYDTANKDFAKCKVRAIWYKVLVSGCIFACTAAAVRCLYLLSVAVPEAIPVWLTAALAAATTCDGACFGALGIQAPSLNATCVDSWNKQMTTCINTFGPISGGAN